MYLHCNTGRAHWQWKGNDKKGSGGWKQADFDASGWREGEKLDMVKSGFEMHFGILKTFMMEQRPIPLLYERPDTLTKELGEAVLGDRDWITVEPGQEEGHL